MAATSIQTLQCFIRKHPAVFLVFNVSVGEKQFSLSYCITSCYYSFQNCSQIAKIIWALIHLLWVLYCIYLIVHNTLMQSWTTLRLLSEYLTTLCIFLDARLLMGFNVVWGVVCQAHLTTIGLILENGLKLLLMFIKKLCNVLYPSIKEFYRLFKPLIQPWTKNMFIIPFHC